MSKFIDLLKKTQIAKTKEEIDFILEAPTNVVFPKDKQYLKKTAERRKILFEKLKQIGYLDLDGLKERLKKHVEEKVSSIHYLYIFFTVLIKTLDNYNTFFFSKPFSAESFEECCIHYLDMSAKKYSTKQRERDQLLVWCKLLFPEHEPKKLAKRHYMNKKEKQFLRTPPGLIDFFIYLKYFYKFFQWLQDNFSQFYKDINKETRYKNEFTKCFYYLKYRFPDIDYLNYYYCLMFIAFTGVRKVEAITLKWKNVFLDQCKVGIIGKGRKKRIIKLNKFALKIIYTLKKIKEVKKIPTPYVFFQVKGSKRSIIQRVYVEEKKTLDEVFHKLIFTQIDDKTLLYFHKLYFIWLNQNIDMINEDLKKHGLEPVDKIEYFCVHQLRHAFATYTYLLTKDLLAIKEYLGHSSIDYTLIYTKNISDVSDISKALEKMYDELSKDNTK